MADAGVRRDGLRWKRLLVEAVVIVGSILLAFGIDAWWDWSSDRRGEAELLGQLRSEFEGNLAVLEETVARHERAMTAGETLLSWAGTAPGADEFAQLDTLFRWALWPAHYHPSSGALRATISSGRLELIRSDSIRNRLAGWDGVLGDLILDEQTRREWIYAYMVPLVAEFGIDASYGPEARLPDYTGALGSTQVLTGLSKSVGNIEHLLSHHAAAMAEADALASAMRRESESR